MLCAQAMWAQTATSGFKVVSAASYQGTVAPDSIAAIFGSNLARTTASATLDANGQLPVELGNARVQVNGQAASLVFVSPGQINFVVPAGIAAGTATVVVNRTDLNTSQNGSALIGNSAPAIFSSDASGAGPGAILNAVTFAPAPFLTVTAQNGADPRTRLAVYGTGIRNARNVTASAADAGGNRYSLTVEFAGAAPGFFGLDQVNVIVPADLDGAGAVSLSVSTEDAASNIVTFQMALLPESSLQLTGLTLTPQVVNSGDSMTATVLLNGVARSSGFPVSLRSNSLYAMVPPSGFVLVPAGKASVNAVITTSPVPSVQKGTIAAQHTVTVSADFELDPPNQVQLSAISVNPASALGGRTVQGTVTLASTAPGGGVSVSLASDNASATVPAAVVVPFNQNSATFAVTTAAVMAAQTVNLTAALNRGSVSTRLSLLPLIALALDSTSVVGGATVTGTVTLAEPAAGGATVFLTSSDNSVALPPAFLTMSAGQTAASFSIPTTKVAGTRTATITAKYMAVTQSVELTINPQPAAALSGLAISPNQVNGGTAVQGTVTLSAPAGAGGFLVSLQSSLPSAATAPGLLTVAAGQSSALFQVTTFRVVTPQTVTITASAGGVTKTATLTVQ